MGFAEWDESYSVGIVKIDEQHKRLFEIINDLYRLAAQKGSHDSFQTIMEKLIGYTVYHFHTEEEIMKKHGFPLFDQHKQEHDRMKAEINGYYQLCVNGDYKCANEVLDALISWLHGHLGHSDNQYAEYFKSKGIVI